MKTTEDLKDLIPTLSELLANNEHKIGDSYFDYDEDGPGICDDYEDNAFYYYEDGWEVEIYYRCCGEWLEDPGDYYMPPSATLLRAWGKVTGLTAYHCDESTGEETVFEGNDLNELRTALDKALEDIA